MYIPTAVASGASWGSGGGCVAGMQRYQCVP